MSDAAKGRKNPRAQVSLVARYRSPTAFEFVKEECFDLSAGGMFIKSPSPAPAGTLIKLECDVNAGAQVIRGVARVVWLRERSTDGHPAGMGVKFVKLEAGGREAIQGILKELGADSSASGPPPASSQPPTAQPYARSPSASPDSVTFRPAASAPSPQSGSTLIIAGAPPQSAPAAVAAAAPAPEATSSARPSNRPEARDLRDRLEQAKRAHEARVSDRPPAMESPKGNRPAARVEDPTERPTPLEMPRPAEVQAAIARASQREAAQREAAREPAKERPAASDSKAAAAVQSAKPAVAVQSAKPAAAVQSAKPAAAVQSAKPAATTSSKPAARTPSTPAPTPSTPESAAPVPSNTTTPFAIGLAVLLGLLVAYIATRPRGEHETATITAPAQTPQPAALPAEPVAPAPAPAPAEAPAAEPAAAPPAPAPEPPTYVLEVETSPEGARVTAGEQTLVSPGRLELGTFDAPLELKAEKDGYSLASATIDRLGFMLEDGRMRRRVVLALAPLPKPEPAPEPAPVVAAPKPAPEKKPTTPPVAVKPARAPRVRVQKPEKPEEPPPPVEQPPAIVIKPVAEPPKAEKLEPVAAPAPAVETKQTPMQAASACLATGDNACVVSALEGKAKSAPEMEMLIETYRAMGKSDLAEKQMQVYVNKFPNERRAASYRRVLQRRQEEAAPPAQAPTEAPAQE
jgi:uncharacterized protein (TIGR02266 family)